MERKKKRNYKKIMGALLIIVGVMVITLLAVSYYFFHVAEVRAEKSFIHHSGITKEDPLYQNCQWFLNNNRKVTWELKSSDGLKLKALFLANERPSNKTAVLIHGYSCGKEDMSSFATMFYRMGYNVIVPDNRAHGESSGKYIGYGWLDRLDYQQWLSKIITELGSDQQIVVMGISMGAATTMMLSGEKLPANVKAMIEDCGYDSVWHEIEVIAKRMYHLPSFPLLNLVSLYSKILAGFDFKEADAIKQLHRNTRPMLFIHGAEDEFVPTRMVDQVYQATNGPKEKLIVSYATHARSYVTNPKLYEKKVSEFLAKYII